MRYNYEEELKKLIEEELLVITPILDESQFGEITFDFRVGTDSLTQHQGAMLLLMQLKILI